MNIGNRCSMMIAGLSGATVPARWRSWTGRGAGRRARLAALAFGVLVLAFPAGASAASFLVYVCGSNLCRVNPDGSGKVRLTTDGTRDAPYSSPSLSRDGKHLAFVRGGSVYTADANARNRLGPFSDGVVRVVMEPNGNQLMVKQTLFLGRSVSAMENQLTVMNLDGSGYNTLWAPTIAGGWGNEEKIGSSQDQSLNLVKTSLCILILTPNRGSSCARTVADDPSHFLFQPTLSPDGATLAVMAVAPTRASPSTIETFDYRSGRLIADLTHGTADRDPTWSPNGKWLAFQRGGSIYKVPVGGGKAQLVVAKGTQPTWAGGR